MPSLFFAFSVLFLFYFIAALMMALHIYTTAKEDLSYLEIFSEREDCVIDFFVFLREDFVRQRQVTLSQNRSTHAAGELADVCIDLEQRYTELLRKNPPVFRLLADDLHHLEGRNACAELHDSFPFTELVEGFE